MVLVLLGALLELAGMVYLVMHVGRGDPISTPASIIAHDTLEPPQSGRAFSFKGMLPGIAMIAVGALLLLVGGRI